MLTIDQIAETTQRVVDIMRKAKGKGKEGVMPDYHNTYQHSVDMKQAIEIHAKPGVKPDKLVAERAPNQTDKEFNYALANYQQTTLPVFLDNVHTMQRAFSDNNWSIDYRQGDDEKNELQQYLEIDIAGTPLKMSYDNFMFQVVTTTRLVDAMGCIAYKPYFIPTVELEGELLIDGTEMFSPIPHYYPSESVVAYEESHFYMFLTEEKSPVEWGNTTVMEGLVYEVYDDTNIFKVIQVGKKNEYKFIYELYHNHSLGYCPVDRLKGIPGVLNGEVIFQSMFLFAVPHLNDVVLDSIKLRSVKAAVVHPFRIMSGNLCVNTMELNGEIKTCDNGYFHDMTRNITHTCSVCKGSGMRQRMSEHGVLLLRPESPFKENELRASQPALQIVSPSVETPQFLREEIKHNTEMARNILHLRTSDSQVKGSSDLTATGMVLDEKALYSTVKIFSDQLFDMYEFGIKTIGLMRMGDRFEMPTVTRPVTFDFATEYEYMERISLAIKNGLPSFVVHEIVYRYIKTMFYNHVDRAKVFDLIITTDRLLVMPNDQINIEAAKGTIAGWEVVLHDSAITIIRQQIEQNPGFLDQELSVQQEQLRTAAKALADSNKAAMPTSNTNVVDAVLRATEAA